MGEDVGLYGGALVSRIISRIWQWRVIDTPISEATIGGAAVGCRPMAGMRPVAEQHVCGFHSRVRWIRLPTREQKTAICSAARLACQWLYELKAVQAGRLQPTTRKALEAP